MPDGVYKRRLCLSRGPGAEEIADRVIIKYNRRGKKAKKILTSMGKNI